MTELEAASTRQGPFRGYGLTLITIASFLVVTILFGVFYPFLPYFLVGVLTVGTAAAAPRSPRLEAQMSRWLLAVAFVAMAVVAVITLPEEVHPNDGPPCPGSGPPLCEELKEWWDGHLLARGQHERGIAVLGYWSLNAAVVLGVRLAQVGFAAAPQDQRGGVARLTDVYARLFSVALLAMTGLALWGFWFQVAWEGIG